MGAVKKALLRHGIDVSPLTLAYWKDELKVEARATNNYANLNERLIHGILNHIEALKEALASGALSYDNLVFADQTPFFICTGHKSAYGISAVFGDGGDAKGGKKVGTLWAVITLRGCIRAWFTKLNGDEMSTQQFFMSGTLPAGWTNVHGAEGTIST